MTREEGNEIKHQLRAKYGITVKQFAEQNNFCYGTVSQVLRGVNQSSYGAGRFILDKFKELGLINNAA